MRADLHVAQSTANVTTRAQFLRAWPKLIAVIGGEIAALNNLQPPTELRQDHLRALAARRGQLQQGRHALALIRAGSSPRSAAAAIKPSVTRLRAKEKAAWRDAGVASCAQ
jgi:hypothetical protein